MAVWRPADINESVGGVELTTNDLNNLNNLNREVVTVVGGGDDDESENDDFETKELLLWDIENHELNLNTQDLNYKSISHLINFNEDEKQLEEILSICKILA